MEKENKTLSDYLMTCKVADVWFDKGEQILKAKRVKEFIKDLKIELCCLNTDDDTLNALLKYIDKLAGDDLI